MAEARKKAIPTANMTVPPRVGSLGTMERILGISLLVMSCGVAHNPAFTRSSDEIASLLHKLRFDRDRDVRTAAALELGKNGRAVRENLPVLIEVL